MEDRVELEDGWSASHERWGKLKREVEAAFPGLSKPSRSRILNALARGERASPLVVRLGGDAAALAAAKRIDALAEKCEIRQGE